MRTRRHLHYIYLHELDDGTYTTQCKSSEVHAYGGTVSEVLLDQLEAMRRNGEFVTTDQVQVEIVKRA
jgi:hypothetical protein